MYVVAPASRTYTLVAKLTSLTDPLSMLGSRNDESLTLITLMIEAFLLAISARTVLTVCIASADRCLVMMCTVSSLECKSSNRDIYNHRLSKT